MHLAAAIKYIWITKANNQNHSCGADVFHTTFLNAYISLKLHDADGNVFTTQSNVVPVESLRVFLGKETIVSEMNEPISFDYYIEGGSGSYDVDVVWSVRNIEAQNTLDTVKEKQRSNGTGTVKFTPNKGTWVGLEVVVKDKNNKNLEYTARTPNGIFLSDNLHMDIEFDKKSVKTGETVIAHLTCNQAGYLAKSYIYWRHSGENNDMIKDACGISFQGNECFVKAVPGKGTKKLEFALANGSEFYFKTIPVDE